MTNEEFQRELRVYVRDKIYKASKQKPTNPVYRFELSIPTMKADTDWRNIAEMAETAIREAEDTITVHGQSIPPAYIVITNHTFLANEDVMAHPCIGLLQTIKIDDYPFGRQSFVQGRTSEIVRLLC